MAKIRVEAVYVNSLGLFYAEVYYPEDETIPLIKSASVFRSTEEIAALMVKALEEEDPDKTIDIRS